MASEPVWLDADLLIDFNQLTVSETGEPHHLRDRGLLESAAARPVNHWQYGERDVLALAVSLLVGIGRNHPFLQGNKRTAFAAMDYFLYLNGYQLIAEDSADLADLVIDLINGDVSEHSFILAIEDLVEEA